MTTVNTIIKTLLLSITLYGFINGLPGAACGLNVAGSNPNILVVFSDDQGCAELSCFGKQDVSNRKEIIDRMPHAQGFDYYNGTLGVSNGSEVTRHRNNKEIGEQNNLTGQHPEKVTHLK